MPAHAANQALPSHPHHTRRRFLHRLGEERNAPVASWKAVAARRAAVGALALGAFAVGALAVGALAIGTLRLGRMSMGRARIGKLEIDELAVRRLRVTEKIEAPDIAKSA